MLHVPLAQELDPAMTERVVRRSLRRWRAARRARQPVQPALFRSLAQYVMLAPVLDSLFRFYEAALDRSLSAGRASKPSEDEALLVSLIDHPELRGARLDCKQGIALSLDCALQSTRIMLAAALKTPESGLRSA